MRKNVLPLLLFFISVATLSQAQPFYLRGSHGAPCDWGNSNSACELLDPDMDGIYELTFDFGAAPIGYHNFKIYDAGTGFWVPFSGDSWYIHQGGTVTFRVNASNFQVEAVDNYIPSICAPGDFSGWNNAEPMVDQGGNMWCYTIASPGTYNWKPTLCGSWNSWEPGNGQRSVNAANWQVTTQNANEQICVSYDPSTGRVTMPQSGIFLRGSHGAPCDWGNQNPGCELLDPDNDGCYDLVTDFGGSSIGRNEFKIYDSANDSWYPGGANAWYHHQGGPMTFRYCAGGGVYAIDGFNPTICAPGGFSGWNNAASMTDMGNGVWCYTVPTAGTYEWKPTVCGSWDSWQPGTGERSTNADNWTITTITDGQQFCLTYDITTGRVSAASVIAIPTMGQWGFILFSLLMLTMGLVLVRQQKLAPAGSGAAAFSIRHLPFNRTLFTRALAFTGLAVVMIFGLAVLVFGYEMTQADIPGSLLAIPLLAYICMLFGDQEAD